MNEKEVLMYTIKDVSKMMEVSEHTLRFWAKSNFFPTLKRNENNVRIFSENDLGWVKIVKCLRNVGVDNKSIKKYIDLCLIGDSTIPERFEIIKQTKVKAYRQMEVMKKQLELLDYKEKYYQNLIDSKSSDSSNPVNALVKH